MMLVGTGRKPGVPTVAHSPESPAGDGLGLGALQPAPRAGLTVWEHTCLPRKLGGRGG